MKNNIHIDKQVKSRKRVADLGEVFTPQYIVEQMVDLIPDLRIETTVLEPSVGEGVFLCEILRRKLQKKKGTVREVLQSIYGVDIMLDNVRQTRKNLLTIVTEKYKDKLTKEQYEALKDIVEKNIRWGDTLACVEAEMEYSNKPPLLFLKDKGVAVKELQFFNYQTNKWENHSDLFRHNNDMIDEINKQRKEYQKFNMLPHFVTIPQKSIVVMQNLFPEQNKELSLF
jgi:type I restriction-modification system DNA methylase subunit